MTLFDNNGNVTIVSKDEKIVSNVNVTAVSEGSVNVQDTTSVPVTQDVSLVQKETTSTLEETDTIQPQEEVNNLDVLVSNVATTLDKTSDAVISNKTTLSDENVVIQEEVSKVAEMEELNKMEESPPLIPPISTNATLDNDVKEVSKTFIPTSNTNYSTSSLGVIDGISLVEMEFSQLVSIVENLLNTGLALLASMPKLGKSWFCLLLCLAVATGKEFLGFKTNKCEVLYLSFESSMRGLQGRLKTILQEEEMPTGIHFYTERKTLDDGLLEFLQDFLVKHPNTKLIIIDTFQFIRSYKTGGGTLYQKEYKEMSQLKEFADENGICILCVHHLKNTSPSKDVFQQIYGSNGIRGATDTNIVLTKLDEDGRVLMSVEGRDIGSTSMIIQRDYETCKWEVVSDDIEEDTYRENPIVKTINAMLQENPEGIKVKMTEVKERMCKDLNISESEYAPQSISREISEHLIPLLMKYDNIRCKRPNPNGGASGRLWHFHYEKEDVTSSQEVSDVETNLDNIFI